MKAKIKFRQCYVIVDSLKSGRDCNDKNSFFHVRQTWSFSTRVSSEIVVFIVWKSWMGLAPISAEINFEIDFNLRCRGTADHC